MHRIGPPRFLGGILIVWGVVASLFAWMRTAMHFYILRFILGLAESGAYPGAPIQCPDLKGCLLMPTATWQHRTTAAALITIGVKERELKNAGIEVSRGNDASRASFTRRTDKSPCLRPHASSGTCVSFLGSALEFQGRPAVQPDEDCGLFAHYQS